MPRGKPTETVTVRLDPEIRASIKRIYPDDWRAKIAEVIIEFAEKLKIKYGELK